MSCLLSVEKVKRMSVPDIWVCAAFNITLLQRTKENFKAVFQYFIYLSPVSIPSPLWILTLSPIIIPSPLWAPPPVSSPSPLRRPSSSRSLAPSTPPVSHPPVEGNTNKIVFDQPVTAWMRIPVQLQGIRRRRDEEDNSEEPPPGRWKRILGNKWRSRLSVGPPPSQVVLF